MFQELEPERKSECLTVIIKPQGKPPLKPKPFIYKKTEKPKISPKPNVLKRKQVKFSNKTKLQKTIICAKNTHPISKIYRYVITMYKILEYSTRCLSKDTITGTDITRDTLTVNNRTKDL